MGLVLEAAAEALAGVGPRGLNAPSASSSAPASLVSEFSGNAGAGPSPAGAYATSKALSVASGRAPYAGPHGPLHVHGRPARRRSSRSTARERRRLDECDRSAVVGVGILTAAVTASFAAAGMLSPLAAATLDLRADGYCRGEGVAAVVVDVDSGRRPSARRARPCSRTGRPRRSRRRTASQRRLIDAVPGADHAVFVLEMHGTGTALGDPIEVGAASARRRLSSFGYSGTIAHALVDLDASFATLAKAAPASSAYRRRAKSGVEALRRPRGGADDRAAPDDVPGGVVLRRRERDARALRRPGRRRAAARPRALRAAETGRGLARDDEALGSLAAPEEIVAADSRALVDSRDAAWTALACRAVAELVASVTLVVDGAFWAGAEAPDANLAILRGAALPSARFALALVFDRPAGLAEARGPSVTFDGDRAIFTEALELWSASTSTVVFDHPTLTRSGLLAPQMSAGGGGGDDAEACVEVDACFGGDEAAVAGASRIAAPAASLGAREGPLTPGAALSVTAGRLPYVLGLVGTCVSVDTACCSALAALHYAVLEAAAAPAPRTASPRASALSSRRTTARPSRA
ncbi:hypothetical protein JL721_11741 [Aureococcus anophagefferens]|nr:hypothetical protein JL721_11741 [Aureococcus anophagefferens]